MNARNVTIVALAMLLIIAAAVKAEDPVVFADANLKAVVVEELQKTDPTITDPTPSDMLLLTGLNASNKGIVELVGLEYAVNLFSLWLDVNEISDISALSGLTNLWRLRLRFNEISDLSVLSDLTNLGELLLSRNPISDISPLSGLTNLMYLELANISTSDISALSNLSNLRWMWLNGNEINDISPLSGLTRVTILVLSNNRITDISALSDLTKMSQMILDNNQISDISPLTELTNLYYLDLRQNPLDCSVYNTVIPMIEENNPGLRYFFYDPIPPECENEPPVADAGEDQRVAVGDTVPLDGSDSSDPDGDTLMYLWSFISIPVGSGAAIAEPTAVQTTFIPDVAGEYIVSLVVNDGTEDSEPDTVTVTTIPPEQAVVETLEETEETISLIPPENLHNENAVQPLSNKIQATLAMMYEGLYEDALDKLENDILKKTDGCAETGAPDATDWILTCEDQADVYPLVMRAIELLQLLVE